MYKHLIFTVAILALLGTNTHAQVLEVPLSNDSHVSYPAKYRIVLPESYETSPNRRYPVIYWLHGKGTPFETNIVTGANGFITKSVDYYEQVHVAGGIEDAILVYPYAGEVVNMWANLWPTNLNCPTEAEETCFEFPDRPTDNNKCPIACINGDTSFEGTDYQPETAFIRELIPHIDDNYRTLTNRESRVLAGYSMGGYGAMSIGLRYPQLFSCIVSVDGALLTQNEMATREPATLNIYFQNNWDYLQNFEIYDAVKTYSELYQNDPATNVRLALTQGGLKFAYDEMAERLNQHNIHFESRTHDGVNGGSFHPFPLNMERDGLWVYDFIGRCLDSDAVPIPTPSVSPSPSPVPSPTPDTFLPVSGSEFHISSEGMAFTAENSQWEQGATIGLAEANLLWRAQRWITIESNIFPGFFRLVNAKHASLSIAEAGDHLILDLVADSQEQLWQFLENADGNLVMQHFNGTYISSNNGLPTLIQNGESASSWIFD